MQYSEAIQYLYDLRLFGTKLGLDQVRQLAEQAGRPDQPLSFVHVAGTNGKGSVCAMLESIYRGSGLKVGMFTSPHLVSFRERMQINRQPIPEEDLVRLVAAMKTRLASWLPEGHPTFFEVVTVMAMQYFAEQKCDLVVWETGLGGRLDATNLVQPRVCVITNVGLDHQQWLGTTIAEVAREKAGIIKPGIPVVTAAEGAALEVIESAARACRAPLRHVFSGEFEQSRFGATPLALEGQHQRHNAAVAAAVVEVMQEVWPVPDAVVKQGLRTAHWPGRMQRSVLSSGMKVVLDGAHNLDGFTVLRRELEASFSGQRKAFVLGVLEDKDWRALCRLLAPLADKIRLVPVTSMRSAAPEKLELICRETVPGLDVRSCATLREAFNELADESLVVVAGSIYLVGETMVELGLSAWPPGNEATLNEASFQGKNG